MNLQLFQGEIHKGQQTFALMEQDEFHADLIRNPYLVLLRRYFIYFINYPGEYKHKFLYKYFFLMEEYCIVDNLYLYRPYESYTDYFGILN